MWQAVERSLLRSADLPTREVGEAVMVSFVQFMAEGEEPPVATFATIDSRSLEARVSETCLAVRRAFNQGHELLRFILDKIAKQEGFPKFSEADRFLRVWHSRAFQLMERCGNEIRVISDGTCAHDAALRFAGQVYGSLTMTGITEDDDHLRRVQLPNLETMNDRLKVEMARALDRVREKSAVEPPSRSWLKTGMPPDGWHKTPLVGQMNQFAKWLGTTPKTLRANNGKTYWITEHIGCDPETKWPAPFAIYFQVFEKFSTVNAERRKEADEYLKRPPTAKKKVQAKGAKGSRRKEKGAVSKKSHRK